MTIGGQASLDQVPPEHGGRSQDVQAYSTEQIDGEEAGRECIVEQVDRALPERHVGRSCIVITLKHRIGPDVRAASPGLHYKVGQSGDVEHAQIEPLCANRRQQVSGLANEGDAVASHSCGGKAREREAAARPGVAQLAQKVAEVALKLGQEVVHARRREPAYHLGSIDPDEAGRMTGQWNAGAWPHLSVQLR